MVGAWTLWRKKKAKRKKIVKDADCALPSTLGDTLYCEVPHFVTASDP